MKKEFYIILFLAAILLLANYNFLDKNLGRFLDDSEFVLVDRVIDGDTFKSGNQSIRLLGINTPEKKEPYYMEAKNFLESEIFNKTVRLEFGKDKKDRYNRTLAYVFLDGENVNLKLIENGLANFYFPTGRDRHYAEFKDAWEKCVDKNINLCKKSDDACGRCIQLAGLSVQNQTAVFSSNCSFSCDMKGWNIKDEGRKKFIFQEFELESGGKVSVKVGGGENSEEILFWNRENYVWTKGGDALFLRDENGGLVLWKSY